MVYFLVFLLLTKFIHNIHSITLFSTECSNRFEFRHEMQRIFPYLKNCTLVKQRNPICGKDIIVSYSEHPPYILQNKTTGKAAGILPDMLLLAFETCCYGCAKINFIGPSDPVQKYFLETSNIVMPVESAKTSKKYIGYDYVHFLEVKGVSVLGKKDNDRTEHLTRHLFKSVLNTWPLFIVALLMAVIAGCVVWVLDTWFNKDEFPSSFPRGPFEGFWWAFVSMTTVGYGDRAPKSVIARLFAIFWIMLGITIFSMYTATLTSALNSNVALKNLHSLYRKKVGVLNTTAAGLSAAIQRNAVSVGFRTVDEMVENLIADKIYAIAFDDNIANYHISEIKEKIPDIRRLHHVVVEHNSYGILSYDPMIAIFLRSFFENNEDNRLTMLAHVQNTNWPDIHTVDNHYPERDHFFSSDSPVFNGTIITLAVLGVVTICIGLLCKCFFKHHDGVLKKCINLQEKKKKVILTDNIELLTVPDQKQRYVPEQFFRDIEELRMKWIATSNNNENTPLVQS